MQELQIFQNRVLDKRENMVKMKTTATPHGIQPPKSKAYPENYEKESERRMGERVSIRGRKHFYPKRVTETSEALSLARMMAIA